MADQMIPTSRTLTENMRLAELAALAYDFLASYDQLPEVGIVSLCSRYRVKPEGEIELQLIGGFDRVLTWARALDTPVRFVEHEKYVEVVTLTSIQGHSVRVWAHEVPGVASAVLMAVGEELSTDGVEVEPSRLDDAARLVALIDADRAAATA